MKKLGDGQIVRIFDRSTGDYPRKGLILNEHSHQSYQVLTEEGRCLRRNREHLRPTLESFQPDSNVEEVGESRSQDDSPECSRDKEVLETEHEVVQPVDQAVSVGRPVRIRTRPKRYIEEIP